MEGTGNTAKITTSQISNNSQGSLPSQNEEENPFLKRKSTNEEFQAKKKEIYDHVEKFGIKKKVEDRGMKKNKI